MKHFGKIIAFALAAFMLFACTACTLETPEEYQDCSKLMAYVNENYTPEVPLSERAKDYVPPASNSFAEDLFSQSGFYTAIFDSLVNLNPMSLIKFGVGFGCKELYGVISKKEKEKQEENPPEKPDYSQEILSDLNKILEKIDEISVNQEKMITELNDISRLVECEQINNVLNTYQQLLNNKLAPLTIYRAIRAEENDLTIVDEDERQLRIKSDLLGGMGFGQDMQVYNRTDVAFDTYTYQLGQAIIGPYRVSFKDNQSIKTESGNIFWIYYEHMRRITDWEHQADEDRASFHVDLLSQYEMAVALDIQSMLARISAIEEYNDKRGANDPYVSDTNVKEMLKALTEQMEKVSELAKEWDVQPHDEYRYFWVPGYETKFVSTIKGGCFADVHAANIAAGISDTVARDNPNEYFKELLRYDEDHALVKGATLAELFKFAGKSGRLTEYGNNFWNWFKTTGDFKCDERINDNIAICSPTELAPGKHEYAQEDQFGEKILYYYYENYYFGFRPDHRVFDWNDEQYYDTWQGKIHYGITKYYFPTIEQEFWYNPDGLDRSVFMIIGVIEDQPSAK